MRTEIPKKFCDEVHRGSSSSPSEEKSEEFFLRRPVFARYTLNRVGRYWVYLASSTDVDLLTAYLTGEATHL